jgi:hypothetical protein
MHNMQLPGCGQYFPRKGWIAVTIRRSKNDQEDVGATVAICRGSIVCPVKTVKEHLDASDITSEAHFRPIRRWESHHRPAAREAESIRELGKAQAAKLGLNPKEFGAHSVRPDGHDIAITAMP